jgi:50S ribosomal protein L16 3-hydroxylase
MDVHESLPLLGGISPVQFMRRHWQKKPLLIRRAVADMQPLLTRAALFALAGKDGVESRLIEKKGAIWRMRAGPFKARSLPPLSQAGWTLLVQGVDLHDARVHALLAQFRFVPDARLDDLMISWASKGGGVGPHFDSYDVFLLQASGRRRWRIGRQKDLTLQPDVPLKLLQTFKPEKEFVLDAGDMLYLPPGYAHDGIAEACPGEDGRSTDCMTYSIGFRAPAQAEMASELLGRLADLEVHAADAQRYRDASQPATARPAELPSGLVEFARQAVSSVLRAPYALPRALGEYLTEPKASVYFDAPGEPLPDIMRERTVKGIALDPKTRMMYDGRHIFINGESHAAAGADARLMRLLADQRSLSKAQLKKSGAGAQALLDDWHAAGWLQVSPENKVV